MSSNRLSRRQRRTVSSPPTPTSDSGATNAWQLLGTTNEWVRFADAKATASLAGSGVLGGLLTQTALREGSSNGSAFAVWAIAASGFLLLASTAFSLCALKPRLSVGEPESLIYFEHVATKYPKDGTEHARALTELLTDSDRVVGELTAQIWSNSLVATRKFRSSSWALFLLGWAGVMAGVAAVAASLAT